MSATGFVALIFAVLLGVEWWFRWKSLRAVIVILALVAYGVFPTSPDYTIAGRRATAVPPAERVRVLHGDTLSQYFTGVLIMREFLLESEQSEGPRLIVLGVLVWLACSPVFRRDLAQASPRST